MNISGLLRLLPPGTLNPGGRNVLFTPLNRTADGWIIQLDGRRFLARTDLKLDAGHPQKALLSTHQGQVYLSLGTSSPQNASDTFLRLQTYLACLGYKAEGPRLDRLQRYWPQAPGASEKEKLKLLLVLEEKDLLVSSVLEGLKALWPETSGNSLDPNSHHHRSTSHQDQVLEESRTLEEDKVSEVAKASVDLFNILSLQESASWVILPFRWEDARGLGRFQIDKQTQKPLQWSFTLEGREEAFLVKEGKERTLVIFTDQDFSPEALSSLDFSQVSLRPRSSFDGFAETPEPTVFQVELYA